MNLGRGELYAVVIAALCAIVLAWLLRTQAWRRFRVAIVGAAVLATFLVVTRRLGLGELLVVIALVVVPAVLVATLRRTP